MTVNDAGDVERRQARQGDDRFHAVAERCFDNPGTNLLPFGKFLDMYGFSEDWRRLYVTPTLQGSRSGAVIAAAWATVVNVGDDGYRHIARALNQCCAPRVLIPRTG